ncbi:MAG: hypothetical protein HYW85_06245, partial [Deltaproteobacteria bacterium]|nr:hypothetical protein [Deltaproteobacteria bacterium]
MTYTLKYISLPLCALLVSGCLATTNTVRKPPHVSPSKEDLAVIDGSGKAQDEKSKFGYPIQHLNGDSKELGGYPKKWDETPQMMVEKLKGTECSSDAPTTIKKTSQNLESIESVLDPSDLKLSTVLSQLPKCDEDPQTDWITGECKDILDRYFSKVDFMKDENQKYFTRILEYDKALLLAKYFRI